MSSRWRACSESSAGESAAAAPADEERRSAHSAPGQLADQRAAVQAQAAAPVVAPAADASDRSTASCRCGGDTSNGAELSLLCAGSDDSAECRACSRPPVPQQQQHRVAVAAPAAAADNGVGPAAGPRLHSMRPPGEPLASDSLELVISSLSTLRHKTTSNFKTIANLPWRLAAKAECSKRTNNMKYLSVYVDCNPDSEATIWACDAVVEFRLQAQQGDGLIADHTKQFTNKFNFSSNNWGFPSFIQWADALNPDKGFIKSDRIILIANITIQKVTAVRVSPTFDFADASSATNDGVLLVDGVRLHVSKAYLSLYSPVFKVMFYGQFRESNQAEVPVEDTILDEFIELLHVIYPSHKPITDHNVEFLLELGDKFEIQYVIDECETHLMKTDNIPIISKLLWADQYSLSKLQNFCIRTFKSLMDVKNLKCTEEWKNLSDATKAALLEKVFKLM